MINECFQWQVFIEMNSHEIKVYYTFDRHIINENIGDRYLLLIILNVINFVLITFTCDLQHENIEYI